ncbi:hypothetical protein ZHAS_00003378 [Anopheles sinensis]|uniref:Uncharacterized protein n=1 Tax=Anopheles sinensis TaxID=74873 RepID=A0A084VE67_ANOSI|nr:hypothetical protein ZHAS_00003378 [Anopheles sinensis]
MTPSSQTPPPRLSRENTQAGACGLTDRFPGSPEGRRKRACVVLSGPHVVPCLARTEVAYRWPEVLYVFALPLGDNASCGCRATKAGMERNLLACGESPFPETRWETRERNDTYRLGVNWVHGEEDTGQDGEIPPQAGYREADAGEEDGGGGMEGHVGGVKPYRPEPEGYVVEPV